MMNNKPTGWELFKAMAAASAVHQFRRLNSGLPDNLWDDMQADPLTAQAYANLVTSQGETVTEPEVLR